MKSYRNVLILGNGRSGRAAERLLRKEGASTVVLDGKTHGTDAVMEVLKMESFELCIVSPGFAWNHPWLCTLREAGVPLLSELELGWSRHRGRTVAVTGSNGKSTAVKWIAESLQCAGYSAVIGGNYGIPACEVVLENPDTEWLVLEVSSFQLETVHEFRPDVAVILNVLPNHLDRHGTMETYRRMKERVYGPVNRPSAVCLMPAALRSLFELERSDIKPHIMTFGMESAAEWQFVDGMVFHDAEAVLDLRDTGFETPVLGGCTGAAVAAVVAACGIPYAAAEAAAQAFVSLPHRLQQLGAINGVDYVNDSKATNFAAMAVGVTACGQNVRLIAGGIAKESDYTFVEEILAERVRSIYLIGQVSQTMYQAWNRACPCEECGTLEIAFRAAQRDALPGEVILLSPGCASFDQFRSFEERGECFNALFRESLRAAGTQYEKGH